jgi:hypothetical protein
MSNEYPLSEPQAYVETETGWTPCSMGDIKKGDTFYLVRDGAPSEVFTALASATLNNLKRGKPYWFIDSKPVE